jgi:hypothetical protein
VAGPGLDLHDRRHADAGQADDGLVVAEVAEVAGAELAAIVEAPAA